ncbi:hypothetical protein Q8G38_00365 [Halomonas venusta]|uniref:hypothetical protein n=1 Tax=Vreelandella venusta TaxID=44935 RepID=UPI00295F4BB6|nr:hypothetical protein [Halomonas venusta]MDW0357762.1 hypothetical protein [Halomonas venusta]
MAKKTTTSTSPVGALSQREREQQVDESASNRYRLRTVIDQWKQDRRTENSLKEVWDL